MPASEKRAEFAICVADDGYDDLQAWKVYEIMPDEKAAAAGCIRVVDESGEDYLYPSNCFARLDIPKYIKARLPKRRPSIQPRGQPIKGGRGQRTSIK